MENECEQKAMMEIIAHIFKYITSDLCLKCKLKVDSKLMGVGTLLEEEKEKRDSGIKDK